MRLDLYITEKGLAKSREQAKELIKSGNVSIDGRVISKPAYDVTDGDDLRISGDTLKYVGRGGLKLEKAISEFEIDLEGRVCIDIGASTGGFTDCMLQNGAAFVYAADVGHGQLDEKLREDSRVANMEGSDIRNLTAESFERAPDFISADVSFISLRLILPKISELLPENGEAVVLIKPQFEAGRAAIGKNGIVKDKKDHIRVLEEITLFCPSAGLSVQKIVPSPITGGSGNREYLAHLKKGGENAVFDFKKIVSSAFNEVY
ncbi:MAG: TlyA family RNA methyltransferase [Oscillospiraceae bacterium]|nr:TlyA family RNA methyltransferase [Oscillospiraceae bacterium]